jgi:hypothetical protein
VWGGLNEVERRQLIERRTMSGGAEPAAPATDPAPAPAATADPPRDGSSREQRAGTSRGRGR